jgi:hypothetical protein
VKRGGINLGTEAKVSSGSFKEVDNIQKKGKTETRKITIAAT